jgi:hypothetical protein
MTQSLHGLEDGGRIPAVEANVTLVQDLRLWDLPSILAHVYREVFPKGQNGKSVNLTTRLYIALR